jgi:hypothetical protein
MAAGTVKAVPLTQGREEAAKGLETGRPMLRLLWRTEGKRLLVSSRISG